MVSRIKEKFFKRKKHLTVNETETTTYYFGPNEREQYITNLQDLEEQGADVVYRKFDDVNGGRIEIRHQKY